MDDVLKLLRAGQMKMNPLRLASTGFLLLSPALTWITIVSVVIVQNVIVFGTAAQSNLLMVASNQLGTNVSGTELAGATASIVLLLVGGLFMLKSPKLGVPVSLAGFLSYLVPFYAVFGTQVSGAQQTFVSPGIGFFVAGVGVFLGVLSSMARPIPTGQLMHSLKTRRGLSLLGAGFGTIGISLDIMNHTALGQFTDFVGLVPLTQVLHLGLLAGVASIALIVSFGGGRHRNLLFVISGATLLLLGVDGLNSYLSGDLADFLGHDLTETVLHLSVYYGVALAFISTFLSS